MTLFRQILLASTALFFTGCVPTERFWWSPDGSRAAVVVEDELRIVDKAGKTLERIAFASEPGEKSAVESARWVSGGDELIVHRVRVFNAWETVRVRLPETEASRIDELAAAMPSLLQASLSLGGDADSVDALLGRLNAKEPALLRNGFFLALEKDRTGTRALLEGAPKALASLDQLPEEVNGYILHELARTDISGTEIESLLATASPLAYFLPSPDESQLAIGLREGDDQLVSLKILAGGNGALRTVAKNLYPAFDWTKGGDSIVFLSPVSPRESLLKQLQRVDLRGDGEPTVKTLATALIPFSPRVEILPDESILVSGQAGRFPSAEIDSLPGSVFHRYVPSTGVLVRVPTSEGALPMNLGYFVASPEGKSVAVVESDTDAVAVVDIESGEVTLVSAPHPNAKCRTLPNWRSEDELSYAALNEESGRIEWILWNRDGTRRNLGSDWPKEATEDWIEIKNPTSSETKPK